MLTWFKAAGWVHGALSVLAGILFFHFWIRTRFWFPKYVHWLAAGAMLVGIGLLLLLTRVDAPTTRGQWVSGKQVLVVLVFPAIVYVAFIFYGGQHAAYHARVNRDAVRCPNCGVGKGLANTSCSVCGQTIPSNPQNGVR